MYTMVSTTIDGRPIFWWTCECGQHGESKDSEREAINDATTHVRLAHPDDPR